MTFLSFNFNGYDAIHTHFISNDFNYVYVTDRDINISGWTVIIDKKLSSMTPWEASLYVRYHPFEYVNDDIVVVIDGSISINPNVIDLIETFNTSQSDLGVMISYQPSCISRIANWTSSHLISLAESQAVRQWMRQNGYKDYIGCFANGVKIMANTELVKQYNDQCYQTICELIPSKAVRLDEVVTTLILETLFPNLKTIAFPMDIINGYCFQYHVHGTTKKRFIQFNPDYFCTQNKNITLTYIGKEYARQYKYKTEAMCLTRYFDESGLREWISHHLSLGFDHIHIFDNESAYPCKAICDEYGDKVSYELITGNAQHYKIFNDYVNSERCKSEWIIPIDDDEYFELNNDICENVNECIDWYTTNYPHSHMFAIRWKHLFPKVFHMDYDTPVLSYCTEENPKLASSFQRMGDRGIKTFVHRYGKIHYETTEENPSGGHVPKHSASRCAILYSGEKIIKCSCRSLKHSVDEPARLIHCRYKGYSWYMNKNKDIIDTNRELDNNSGKPYTHYYKFNELLATLS